MKNFNENYPDLDDFDFLGGIENDEEEIDDFSDIFNDDLD